MDGGGEIPTLLCIDVEPDRFQIGAERNPSFDGFGLLADYLTELRPRLEEATGNKVNYSWFIRMDPQIAEVYGSPSFLYTSQHRRFSALIEAGDEIGLHVHAWKFDVSLGQYYEAIDDEKWIEHTIDFSLKAFHDATGSSCLIHRYGAGYFSNEIVALLRQRGVKFDLTCEPGSRNPDESIHDKALVGCSDHRLVPRWPYVPSAESFAMEDSSKQGPLTLVPLTSVKTLSAIRKPDRWVRGHRGPSHRTHRMWRGDMDPDRFWSLAGRSLGRSESRYLAFAIRSHTLTVEPDSNLVRLKLETIVTHPLAKSLHFTTPSRWLDGH